MNSGIKSKYWHSSLQGQRFVCCRMVSAWHHYPVRCGKLSVAGGVWTYTAWNQAGSRRGRRLSKTEIVDRVYDACKFACLHANMFCSLSRRFILCCFVTQISQMTQIFPATADVGCTYLPLLPEYYGLYNFVPYFSIKALFLWCFGDYITNHLRNLRHLRDFKSKPRICVNLWNLWDKE